MLLREWEKEEVAKRMVEVIADKNGLKLKLEDVRTRPGSLPDGEGNGYHDYKEVR